MVALINIVCPGALASDVSLHMHRFNEQFKTAHDHLQSTSCLLQCRSCTNPYILECLRHERAGHILLQAVLITNCPATASPTSTQFAGWLLPLLAAFHSSQTAASSTILLRKKWYLHPHWQSIHSARSTALKGVVCYTSLRLYVTTA